MITTEHRKSIDELIGVKHYLGTVFNVSGVSDEGIHLWHLNERETFLVKSNEFVEYVGNSPRYEILYK